jgi:hypothetical protein
MPKFAIFVILMVLCCAVTSSFAATIHVPSQQPTIQVGINAAVNGDTVLVAPGVYVGPIQIGGKRIVLRSIWGPEVTTIQGTVSFVNSEQKGTTLSGFRITSGSSSGINCYGSSVDITNNIIEGNEGLVEYPASGTNQGGGITLRNTSKCLIKGNIIRYNTSEYGSGIHVGDEGFFSTSDTVCYNLFYNNVGVGEIRCLGAVHNLRVFNNTIITGQSLVLGHQGTGLIELRNNIFLGDVYDDAEFTGTLVAEYNDIFEGDYFGVIPGTGSISTNPRFRNQSTYDYALSTNSPCIDAGDPDVIYNDWDGTRNDIGALPHFRQPKMLFVPTEFASIQSAIDASSSEDTVYILPGIYSGFGNVDLNLNGKSLTIVGAGPDSTIIDCGFDWVNHRGLLINSNEEFLTLQSLAIRNGSAPDSPIGPFGGAILTETQTDLTIVDCDLSAAAGGAIYMEGGKLQCISSIVTANGGTGVFAQVDSLVLSEVRVSGCSYGIDAFSSHSEVTNCTLSHNIQGARFTGGTVDLSHCSFDSSASFGLSCSGVIAALEGCTFSGNAASGLYLWQTGFGTSVRGSAFHGNKACGMVIEGDHDALGTIRVANCVFDRNSGQFAGALQCSYDMVEVQIDSCTFFGNFSTGGSIIHSYDLATISISSSVLAYNQPSISEVSVGFGANFQVSCSNIFGNYQGDWVGDIAPFSGLYGNLSTDPLFCDTSEGRFSIAVESPCAPGNNQCGLQIGAGGIECSTNLQIDTVLIENESHTHVLAFAPRFVWELTNLVSSPQDSFLIAVGTDSDWQFAEKWNPAPFASSDTFVVYDGSALVDGQTYYLRLRVHNSLAWSDWYQTSFRMNSVPTAPAVRTPTDLAVVGSTPILWVTNGTDAETDPLTYEFAGFHDTDCVAGPDISLLGVAQTADSTGGQIVDPLAENCRYFWRARAYDGFEYSAWTPLAQFLVNGAPEAPSTPSLDSPPLPDNKPVFTLLPTLSWLPSYDPDPADTVRYKLELSDRANFSFALVRDSLLATDLPLVDSLVFGTHYYWRVTARDKTSLTAMSSVKEFWTWRLGDLNHSHSTDLSDLSLLIAYLVQSPRPVILPKMVADLTGDCGVDLSDLSTMIAYMTTTGIVLRVGCE